MNPQDIVNLVAAFGAAILGIMPVYQKWREVRRNEALADRREGVDSSIKLSPLKEAVEETAKDKYNLFTLFLGLLISVSLVWNVVRGSYVVHLVEEHYKSYMEIRKEVIKHAEDTSAALKRIEAKLK